MERELNHGLNFDFEWLGQERGDLLERATYASLKIEAGGEVVTEVKDELAKTVRERVRVSAYRLACWLAANWWRLRWEPSNSSLPWRLSHHVAAAGGGYVWPDVTFASDGETVSVEARASSRTEGEAIRYLNSSSVALSVEEFESGVFEFIEAVRNRLMAVGVSGSNLHTLWDEVRSEREDPEATKWRKLEALLGFDPDEAPELLVKNLNQAAQMVGDQAMEEVASASKSEAMNDLRTLWEEARNRTTEVQVSELPPVQADQELVTAAGPPWKRGEELARTARAGWGVERGPIHSRALSDLTKVSEAFLVGDEGWRNTPMPAAFRNGQNGRLGVVIDKGHPNARRFALARLIADHLSSDPRDRLLPATDANTARQKLQRAFASEFLCPFDELQKYFDGGSPDNDEIEDVAAHFEVSPLLIATKLVNKGVLERDALADWRFD